MAKAHKQRKPKRVTPKPPVVEPKPAVARDLGPWKPPPELLARWKADAEERQEARRVIDQVLAGETGSRRSAPASPVEAPPQQMPPARKLTRLEQVVAALRGRWPPHGNFGPTSHKEVIATLEDMPGVGRLPVATFYRALAVVRQEW